MTARSKAVLAAAASVMYLVLGAGIGDARNHRKPYRDGREAIVDKRWSDAANLMREAIESEPTADPRLSRNLAYVPYYYLGLALFGLGDCPGATREWDESERQGVVVELEFHQILVEKRALCENQRQREEALARARDAVEAARTAGSGVETRRQDESYTDSWTEELAERFREALALVQEAEELVADGRPLPTLAELDEVLRSASGAQDRFLAIEGELDSGFDLRLAEAQSELDELLARAVRQLDRIGVLAPFPPRIGVLSSELEALVVRVRSLSSPTPGVVQQLTAELAEAVTTFERAASFPPTWLRAALEQYLQGNYEVAIGSLNNASTGSSRTRGHLLLLRAASSYAWDVSLGGDTEHRDSALRDLEELVESRPGLEPTRQLFAPGFVELYETVRSSDTG